uniref:RDD domain-containing protein n=1 Tax=Glossina palpalis gambiensis TaxID=67801 RepID=A0A1B0BX76_9MUSC
MDKNKVVDNLKDAKETVLSAESANGMPKKEISTKEAYFASLNEWVKHANISQNAMALFPWYLMSTYPQVFQQHTALATLWNFPTAATTTTQQQQPSQSSSNQGNSNQNVNQAAVANIMGRMGNVGLRILSDQSQIELINLTGGYEYIIAPFWKRAIAEIIDIAILLMFKISIIFVAMNVFDLQMMFELDKNIFNDAVEKEDFAGFFVFFMDFLAFSSDLLLLEAFTKIFVCLYEAIWTALPNGATPGKIVMGLSIKYVEATYPLQQQQQQQQANIGLPLQLAFPQARVQMRALLFPAETLGFWRAFMRAVAKNMIISLLFPVCFLMIFFKSNRTAYDVMTKTIVVEKPSEQPLLRRDLR